MTHTYSPKRFPMLISLVITGLLMSGIALLIGNTVVSEIGAIGIVSLSVIIPFLIVWFVVSLWILVLPRPLVVLSADGFFDRRTMRRPVPWSEIEAISRDRIVSWNILHTVRLKVRDPALYTRPRRFIDRTLPFLRRRGSEFDFEVCFFETLRGVDRAYFRAAKSFREIDGPLRSAGFLYDALDEAAIRKSLDNSRARARRLWSDLNAPAQLNEAGIENNRFWKIVTLLSRRVLLALGLPVWLFAFGLTWFSTSNVAFDCDGFVWQTVSGVSSGAYREFRTKFIGRFRSDHPDHWSLSAGRTDIRFIVEAFRPLYRDVVASGNWSGSSVAVTVRADELREADKEYQENLTRARAAGRASTKSAEVPIWGLERDGHVLFTPEHACRLEAEGWPVRLGAALLLAGVWLGVGYLLFIMYRFRGLFDAERKAQSAEHALDSSTPDATRARTTFGRTKVPLFLIAAVGSLVTLAVLRGLIDGNLADWAKPFLLAVLVPVCLLTFRFCRRLFWRGPFIVIDRNGIFDRRTMIFPLPWPDIAQIDGRFALSDWLPRELRGTSMMIRTHATASGVPPGWFGSLLSCLVRPRPYPGSGPLAIDLDMTNASMAEFLDACAQMSEPRPAIGPAAVARSKAMSPRLELAWKLTKLFLLLALFLATFLAGIAVTGSALIIPIGPADTGPWLMMVSVGSLIFALSPPLSIPMIKAVRSLLGKPD